MGDMADAVLDDMDRSWDYCCRHCGEDEDCDCYDDKGVLKPGVVKNKAYRDYWKARGIPENLLPRKK